jgi:hypothetical protein
MSERQQQLLSWLFGIFGGLVVLAASGGVLFDREIARQIADQGARIKNMENQFGTYVDDKRVNGTYNYSDAMKELNYRDQAIKRLEDRMDRIEGGYQRGPR